MSTRTLGWLVAIVAVVGGVYALSQRAPGGTPSVTGPVRIGVVLPLSGAAAPVGVPIRRAIAMAVEEVNAAGGVRGRPVEVVWGDGMCTAADATVAAPSVFGASGVRAVLGGACSAETLALAPLAESAKTPLVSPCAASPKISDAGEFVFRTYPSDALAGRVAAEYAAKVMGAKKVAIISERAEGAQGLRNAFRVAFGQYGGAVAVDEVYDEGADDLRMPLRKARAASPDLVYVIPETEAAGLLAFQQLRDLGYRGKRLTSAVFLDRALVREYARLAEGIVGVEAALDEADPKVAAFLAKYQEQYGEPLSGIPRCGADGYAQVHLLAAAIAESGDDPAKIRDWIAGRTEWQGPLGAFAFDRNGDAASGVFGVQQVVSGQVRTLGTQRFVGGNLEAFVPAR